MVVEIRRLAEDDLVKEFDCGDHALNDYLRRHAWINQQQNLVGVTYVAIDQGHPRTVIGYYTLATSAIRRDSLPGELTKGLPRYQNLPVILLARLAADHRFQGSGLGKNLLRHALTMVLDLSQQIGCLYLVVDAYPTAVCWYARFGFISIGVTSPSGTQPMFVDLRTVAGSLI